MARGHLEGDVITCLRADGGGYRQVQGRPVFILHRPNAQCVLKGVLEADEDEERVLLHVLLPIEVPARKRRDILEYVGRANLAHGPGHLEFDPDDTIILYVAAIDAAQRSLALRAFQRFLTRTLAAASQHTSGVIAVVRDNRSPVAALEHVGCHSLRQTLARVNTSLDV